MSKSTHTMLAQPRHCYDVAANIVTLRHCPHMILRCCPTQCPTHKPCQANIRIKYQVAATRKSNEAHNVIRACTLWQPLPIQWRTNLNVTCPQLSEIHATILKSCPKSQLHKGTLLQQLPTTCPHFFADCTLPIVGENNSFRFLVVDWLAHGSSTNYTWSSSVVYLPLHNTAPYPK